MPGWGYAALAFDIATNIATTTLIAWRIRYQRQKITRAFGQHTRHASYYNVVLALVIESGALYTLVLILGLITFAVRSPAVFIVDSALSQIAGIVPTLILVYSALGNTIRPASTSQA